VVAQAGIAGMKGEPPGQAWTDVIDTNLIGVINAVLFLASDESRFVTGTQLRVEAGGYLKWYDYRI
jgi:NAD(P)-dependent dehydrogenase (short-subunit alcohol dehydrogenase family)